MMLPPQSQPAKRVNSAAAFTPKQGVLSQFEICSPCCLGKKFCCGPKFGIPPVSCELKDC